MGELGSNVPSQFEIPLTFNGKNELGVNGSVTTGDEGKRSLLEISEKLLGLICILRNKLLLLLLTGRTAPVVRLILLRILAVLSFGPNIPLNSSVRLERALWSKDSSSLPP